MKLEELTIPEANVLVDAIVGYRQFKPDDMAIKTLWDKISRAVSVAAEHERKMKVRH